MSQAAPDAAAEAAFAELVEELTARLQRGEPFDAEACLRDHPEHAERLRKLLPALRMLDELSGSRDAALSFPPAGPDDPTPTGTLGDFRLIREVGRGGMGVVYEAEQISLGRRVALKVLPFAATLDPRQLQRFQNESRAAASLDHPHIVHVHAVGQERGVHYYAMQFIEGQTLAALIADLRRAGGLPAPRHEQPTTPHVPGRPAPAADTALPAAASTERLPRNRAYFRRVAEWGIQAAEALEHAHGVGIVHRDVKPANLMVDGRGNVWVTDFGLAQVQSDARLTMTGDVVGTLRYMSAEQALAKRGLVDHRTDIYALGATLYELLTLQPAFPGNDREELLRQIAFEEPQAPRRVNRAVPPELDTVVLKALEKNATERYATARELADDLRCWLEDRPIHARRPSLVQRARKWARRHRALVWSAAVCSLLAVTALGGSIGWVAREGAERRAKAAEGFDETLGRALTLMEEGNWPQAKAAAQRAADLLAGEGGDDPRRQRLRQVEAHLTMVTNVELARAQRAALEAEHFDNSGAARAYAEAFRDYNLPVLELEAEEAARRIAASPIRRELLAALGGWFSSAQDPAVKNKLNTVVLLADKTPWQKQVYDALDHNDWSGLARLAQDQETFRQPPAHLVALGNTLARTDLTKAVDFMQRAQQRHPNDFWINHSLAEYLTRMKPPRRDEAIGYFRAALAARPQSPGAHLNLGNALQARGRLAQAEAEFREALRLAPDYSGAHYNLGGVLKDQGLLDEAITEHREAIRLNKEDYEAYTALGDDLIDKGLPDEAITVLGEAIHLNKEYSNAHTSLGNALRRKGRLDEAIAAHREALRLNKDNDVALTNLGNVLLDKRLPDQAIAEYHKAIRLNQENYKAHNNLALALYTQGRLEEAITEYRVAIQLKPDWADAHQILGLALGKIGRLDEAITAFNQAIRLKPDLADAHHNLGIALQQKGRLDEAVASLTKALRLKPGDANTQRTLNTAQELLEADTRLTKVLSGERQPANAAERAQLALLCAQPFKQLPATAARFYAEAFAAEPKLADDLNLMHRYNAACAAALAGCGQGKDGDQTDAKERARLRKQALDWLRADLAAWNRVLTKDQAKAGPTVARKMTDWQNDPDFAGVRNPEALAKLPEGERADWQKLWADVEETLAKVRQGNDRKDKPAK
jgi:serine/threonine protein kinase/Flp pilus assembly protein TadD